VTIRFPQAPELAARPDRRRDRPLDEIHVVRPGMLCGIADRPPFDLRDSEERDHHRGEDCAKPPLRP